MQTLRRIFILALVGVSVANGFSSPVTWDGGGDGTNWHNPLNWSGDLVPGATNEVVIDLPGTNASVTILSGNVTVRSLQCEEALVILGGTLTLTDSNSQLNGSLTIARRTALTARGAGTTVTAAGVTDADGADLYALDGASIFILGLHAYADTSGCCGSSWEARGTGSHLRVPSLTNLTGNPVRGWPMNVRALSGGRIEAVSLADLPAGDISALAEATNSVVDLSGLQQINANLLSLEARTGGSVQIPQVTNGSRLLLTVRAGGTIPTAQLASLHSATADGTSLDLGGVTRLGPQGNVTLRNGGSVNLGSVTNADGQSFYAQGGAVLTLPAVSSYADTAGCCGTTMEASGAGSRIRLLALTNLLGNPVRGWPTRIRALAGGRIESGTVAALPGGDVAALADGTNSVVDLGSLVWVNANLLSLEARAAGSILVPQLTDGSRVVLTLRAGGIIPTLQFMRLYSLTADGLAVDVGGVTRLASQGAVTLQNGGTANLGGVTNLDGLSLYVPAGTTLSLPGVRGYVDTSGCCGAVWEARGAGARLHLPGLTNFAGNPTWAMTIQALAGGTVDLGSIQAMADSRATLLADGSNSVVNLGALPEFRGVNGSLSINVQARGTISTPSLARLNRGSFTLQTAGRWDFPQLTNIDGSSFYVRVGETLSLSNISSYVDTSGCCGAEWEANGAGASLAFPNLASFTGNPTWAVSIRGLAGGAVDLNSVTNFPDSHAGILADGTNSVVSLAGLPEFRGINGYLTFAAQARGTIQTPRLARLNRGSITRQTGGRLDFPLLANVDGCSFYVRAGESLSLSNITRYADTSGCCGAEWEANGAGAALRFPSLASFTANPTWAMSVASLAGGLIDLGAVVSLPDSRADILADGTNSVVDLSRLAEFQGVTGQLSFEARNAGVILLDALLRLNHSVLTLRNSGFLPTMQLRSLIGSTVTIDGRPASFAGLTDIRGTTFLTPNGGSAVFAPAADLAVSEIQAPGAAIAGQPMQLTWSVANLSTNPATGPRHDAVYLSTDPAFGNDLLMASFAVADSIPGGGTQRITNTVILPGGITGNRYFIVQADAAYKVFEGTNETNNVRVSTTPVITSAADLVVDSFSAPTNATFGQMITLSWRVRNAGSVPAQAHWHDRIYLSTNATVSPGAFSLATVAANDPGPLAAGASYTRTQAVSLPLSGILSPGQWYVVVKSDYANFQAESDEGNNTRATGAIPIARPPLPDLAVTEVTAPAFATPGLAIAVSWAITNRGAATASNVWSETLVLSADDALGNDSTLASFTFTNSLVPAASLTRTQDVTIPAGGLSGALRLGVVVDTQQNVVEADESNNAALSSAIIEVPRVLTLTLSAAHVTENVANPALTARVTRNGDLGSSLVVSLTSSDGTELAMPATTLIPAQVASTTVDLSVVPDGVVDGPQTVTVIASASGFASASNRVAVLDADMPRLNMLVSGAALVEGGVAAASITRDGDLSQPLSIAVANSSPGQISMPGTVIIPAQETTANFTVLAVDDYYVESKRTYTITATAPGYEGSFAAVTVEDDDLPPLSLALDVTRLSEGAGPAAATLTIARVFETIAPLTVRLTRTPPGPLTGASEVTFAPGELIKSVPLSPVNNDLLDGNRAVTLTVQALETLSLSPVAPGVTTNLIVLDDDGPGLRLALSRDWLCPDPGSPSLATLTATLTRHGNTNSSAVVALAANVPGLVTFPATVSFAPNVAQRTFAVNTVAAPTSLPGQTLLLSATAPGFADASIDLALKSECAPDLVISNVVVAAHGLTDAYFSVNFRELNIGAPFAIVAQPPGVTNIAQRVFLSSDPYPGGDTFLGAVLFDGTVNPYTFLDRSATFRLPSVPGEYWIFVQADGSNSVSEASEENNFAPAPFPIRVDPAYTATVSASPHTALAGTPVTLSGAARKFGTALPAPFEIVSLSVGLRGTTRVIAALTDANGSFSAAFTPLPGEAGTYTVAVAHPGVTNVPVQDTFTLLGMRANPASLALRLPAFSSATQHVAIANLGDTPLTGLGASVIGAPPEFSVSVGAPASLAPFGEAPLTLSFRVNADINLSRLFTVRVTSAEGAVADVIVTLTAESLRPRLDLSPASLLAGVVPGGQRFVEFSVANLGGAISAPLQVLPPSLSWLHVVTPLPLPPLAPGESNTVTLQLAPAPGTPLGDVTGTILVSGGPQVSVSVPFSFRVLSTNSGSLRVEVTDQFTYYAEGAPRVTNAVVELHDPASGQPIANGVTDAAGIALFPNLTEAYYTLEVSATGHGPYRRAVLVGAGAETRHEALLNREVVQFLWNVVPTEIGDRTRITIEATFETVVPVPVVTVEPSVIDLANYPNGGVISLTITNHGLLAAQQTRLSFSEFDCWKLTPLISDLGTLAARSAMVVPVTICRDPGCTRSFGGCGASGLLAASDQTDARNEEVQQVLARVGNFQAADAGGGRDGGSGNCGGGALIYFVPCGNGGVSGSAPVGVANAGGDCSWHPTGGGSGSGSLGGGSSGVGGAPCNPCPLNLLKAILKCAIKFIPLEDWQKCVKDVAECGWGLSGDPGWKDAYKCVKTGFTCAKAAGKSIPWLKYLKYFECAYDILTACPGKGPFGGGGGGGGGGGDGLMPASQTPPWAVTSPELYPLFVRAERLNEVIQYNEYLFGTNRWFKSEDTNVWGNWFETFDAQIETNSASGEQISAAERAALLALPLPEGVTALDANRFLDRWNRSLEYWQAGIFNLNQVAAGQNSDFIAMDRLQALATAARSALLQSEAEGFTDLIHGIEAAKFDLQSYLSQPTGGICARVKLRIDQEAVIARDAFRATLDIVNNTGSPLTNVMVDVVVYRPDGSVATDLFGISPPALNGLSAVDGTGRVNAASTGAAAWNILPSVDAAPDAPVLYAVGGSIRYVQDGLAVTVPLALVSITVHPLAQLQLAYFHQRDVLGDDPFTDEIESSVPYSLAVMVRNTGHGTARNLRITSAQPQIVENEKGLFIDFQIIATEVAGRNLVPSLTANFGDIGPGTVAIGQWLFKSTLQGLFTSYSARFEHLDSLGEPRLSLVQGVEIHELIRVVRAAGAFEDGLPDLLVNDFPDLGDLPDTLYLSDGRRQPVSIVQTGLVNGAVSPAVLQASLTAPLPAGWSYLRMEDPSGGRLRLVGVVRSDSTALSVGTNVWITDRTFVGGGRRPVRENRLHLLDYNSTGIYTLIYEPIAGVDTVPPTSSVAALPLVSGERIPVIWTGEDNLGGGGVAFYDVFVSINSGPFQPWLQQTALTGSLYDGLQGNTYAFYSVATDLAGNRETSPLAPDAITGVNFTNTPPVLASATLQVNEGDTLRYTNAVIDPDVPPQALSFSLLGFVPAGATLSPFTGVLTWPTSEATGPGTNTFTVLVSDNGFPSYTATGFVTVIVREINRAPTLAAITNRTVSEGQLLSITNVATDPDVPANILTYSLVPGAPSGASIDSLSGRLAWRPTEVQGGTTNNIAVVVTDSGQPSLSATQRFNVIVRDTLGDFELSLGSTHVLTGEGGSVPVTLKSGIQLSRIDVEVEISASRISNLVLRASPPEISSLLLLPLGSNRAELSFAFDPQLVETGSRELAQLGFEAVPGTNSAIVPLRLSQLSGRYVDGRAIARAISRDGRVFVIGRQPLLDVQGLTNGSLTLVLYGHSGTTYTVEYSTNLSHAAWLPGWSWPLTNSAQTLETGPIADRMLFWRARGP